MCKQNITYILKEQSDQEFFTLISDRQQENFIIENQHLKSEQQVYYLPKVLNILKSWSISESPGKSGRLVILKEIKNKII